MIIREVERKPDYTVSKEKGGALVPSNKTFKSKSPFAALSHEKAMLAKIPKDEFKNIFIDVMAALVGGEKKAGIAERLKVPLEVVNMIADGKVDMDDMRTTAAMAVRAMALEAAMGVWKEVRKGNPDVCIKVLKGIGVLNESVKLDLNISPISRMSDSELDAIIKQSGNGEIVEVESKVIEKDGRQVVNLE